VKGIDLAFVRLNRLLGGDSISSKLDRIYRCEMHDTPPAPLVHSLPSAW
jgi:hypothetical protein